MKSGAGFTLIEILLTVAVMGIMSGIAVFSFFNFQTKQQLRDGVVQFAGELNNLRAQARKTSSNWTITWVGGASNYQVTNNSVTTVRNLATGVKFDGSGSKTLNFQAPYGLLDQTNLAITLKGRNNATQGIYLIGMGGKVVIK
ncbi:pilus assembly FimT family protein [Deinococcus roseus]|uniref:Prepilin-type N-terminal cleavage/methylation domain-containing protein n=1 Tax=Deinococcus roseus TaxID=392414 RepID=A0ABQ2DDM6_9DEIO|nr:prepilin-type N-terminal cleavage/methylation domain-containing protein [Deinococcus roseus]GGJ53972.1 hypothetical protein GCM10008938_45030 [Deinococcus roseus]